MNNGQENLNAPLVELRELTIRFGAQTVLSEINLDVKKVKLLLLLVKVGAGKPCS